MMWKTIDSAPKDGTSILVFMDGSVFEASWYKYGWSFPSADSHGCGCCGGEDDHPSFWMPLPEPPNVTK